MTTLNYDDILRDHLVPRTPTTTSVTVNASGGAWVALVPPTIPAGNFRSYDLTIEGASAAYEMTWESSPAVGVAGMKVPADTLLQFSRVGTPNVDSTVAYPSFRALGGTGFTLRMTVFTPMR